MTIQPRDVAEHFAGRFSQSPRWIIRAPGRVNLIGEHTDYNDGFVLPLAIDRAIWIALRPRDDRRVVVHSIDYDEPGEFSLDDLSDEKAGWIEYLKGTAWALQEGGFQLTGWEGVLIGDVPLGAGLSSSAALEVATARAFAAVSQFEWDPAGMAKLCQRAENEWVGVNCGIMDQTDFGGRPGRTCLADRLPIAGDRTDPLSRGCGGRGARYVDAPRPGRVGLQRAPRPVRIGRRFLQRLGASRRGTGSFLAGGRRPGRDQRSAARCT